MQLVKNIIEIASKSAGGRRLFSAVLAAALWAALSAVSIGLLAAQVGVVLSLLLAMSATLILEGSLIARLSLQLHRHNDTRSPEEAAEILGLALLCCVCWVPGVPAAAIGLLWLSTPLVRWLGTAAGIREPALLDLVRTIGALESTVGAGRAQPESSSGPPTGGQQAEESSDATVHAEQEVQREQADTGESD